jgi:AraC-like DNA-binding protein
LGITLRAPPPPLSAFVEALWLWDGGPVAHAKERLLPSGTVELVINLWEDETAVYGEDGRCQRLEGAAVAGPHARSCIIDTAGQRQVMGAHFRPGGAFPFLGLPVDELRDLHVSLGDLWGRTAAGELRERLLSAMSPVRKLAVLESALLARVKRPRHPAVAHALRVFHQGPVPVGEVVGAIGLSQRRFIELFKAEVGLAPKLYCRIHRFQDALKRMEESPETGLAGLALACGYFDQAHFGHDFRAFSGFSPSAYLARRSGHLNHVPLV